jgi:predicted ATPase/class 3 adenylate cyclase
MSERPTGTVTFLFTDIEGSTTRWEHHPDAMRTALARHDALLRQVISAHGGFVFKMMGDAVYAAFAVAADAVTAAIAAQRAVSAEQWGEVGPLRVRMALHTGAAQSRDDDYFGPTLNRVARLLSTGYGGQVLLSAATQELTRDSLPVGVSLLDLGEYALKDLLRPGHIFQLIGPDLPAEFPPLKSLSRHPQNLPMQPTPFIGREQEVTTVCELLRRPEVRLLTLTGPGGMGKTRLGLQVAAELSDQFADGVFLVPLAPVSDPEQVMPAIIQALGLPDIGQQDPLALLKTALRDKRLLLVLDNFEQVVDTALVVADLLAACPRLNVLVTSCMALHLRGEHEFVVPPLSVPNLKRLPDLATLSQYEAVALFIQRSQAVKPDFQVTNANAPAVAAICARLDGLPLAIELAAARSKFFAPQALLARLEQGLAVLSGGARDLPARQQTLRGAIAWSYHLLSPEEQHLFRRLSVFVDSWTWEAAEVVCRVAGELGGDILDRLFLLVDKSLLRQEESADGEPRFWMLQTLREFGLECLASTGELEATRTAHALYYLTRAEEAEPQLRGADSDRWFARLEQEHENLRAALSWLLERAEMRAGSEGEKEWAEQAMRLCGALYWFWNIRGYYRAGRSLLERALAVREGVAASVQIKVLYAASALAAAQDDFERAEALCRESLALSRELGDTAYEANALCQLGLVAWARGRYAQARAPLEEAVAFFQELGDTWNRARSLSYLARVFTAQGEYGRARALAEESLELSRVLGDKGRIAMALGELARVRFLAQDDFAQAQALAEQSLALFRELGDTQYIAYLLSLLGEMHLMQSEQTQARELLEESVAIFKELGDRWCTAQALLIFARVAASRGELAAAGACYQESLAIAREIDAKNFIASALEGAGAVVAAQGEPGWAARLWGAAQSLRVAIGTPLPPVYRADHERALATARSHLGEEAFATALAAGGTMALEQTLDALPNLFSRLDERASRPEACERKSGYLSGR